MPKFTLFFKNSIFQESMYPKLDGKYESGSPHVSYLLNFENDTQKLSRKFQKKKDFGV